MSISVEERVVDVAVSDFKGAKCSKLYCGPPEDAPDILEDSPMHHEYKACGKVMRWYFGLMGETSPRTSPLSVDVAGDKEYHVYRYDWVFGVSLPVIKGVHEGDLWWDWQDALSGRTPITVQVVIRNGKSGIGYTCVASNLNVLPPSRDTSSWWQKNKGRVINTFKSGANTAAELAPGMITKTVAALSNSLNVQGRWNQTNWFIYQFHDQAYQACGVEWRINKKVLLQYGPVLRGSLVLAFHGPGDIRETPEPIRLVLRPNMGFNGRDDLKRVTPPFDLDQTVHLKLLPRADTSLKSS